jgi:hypothetical protein
MADLMSGIPRRAQKSSAGNEGANPDLPALALKKDDLIA